jgi:DNA invertase Pin-like site-specific DNA recombinase
MAPADIKSPFLAIMKTALSYLRWSTPAQSFGDSERRQLAAHQQLCQQKGWKLTDFFADKGVSAYHGKHRANGSLGHLLKLAKPGQVVLIEDCDRWSREEPLTAMNAMQSAVNNGLEFYFTRTSTHVTQANFGDMNVLLPNFITSMLGNQESAKKAQRLREVWAEKKRKAAKGEAAKLPLPCWLKRTPTGENGSTPKVVVDESKAAVVRQIFSWAAAGLRWVEIARKLQGVPPITRAKNGSWNITTLRRMLKDKTVLGFYCPRQGEPVKDYFPAILDEREFYAAQGKLGVVKEHGQYRHHGSVANLFTGLVRCQKCGGSLTLVGAYGGKYLKFVCSNSRQGRSTCGCRGIPTLILEKVVFELLRGDLVAPADAKPSKRDELAGKLAVVKTLIDKAHAIFWQDGPTQIVADKLASLEAERKTIQAEMEAEEYQAQESAARNLGLWQEIAKAAEFARMRVEPEGRAQIRGLLSALLERVEVGLIERGKTVHSDSWPVKIILRTGAWASVRCWRNRDWRLEKVDEKVPRGVLTQVRSMGREKDMPLRQAS